jgi:hypothetical protein
LEGGEQMQIFNNLEEAIKSRERVDKIYDQSKSFSDHRKKYSLSKIYSDIDLRDMGKFFLYELVIGNKIIHYPKLAMYINSIVVDQAEEIEFVNVRRNCEYRIGFINENGYENNMSLLSAKIDSVILWSNDLLVYGVWDKKPNWKELKGAYEKTWWYRLSDAQKRERKINLIVNG